LAPGWWSFSVTERAGDALDDWADWTLRQLGLPAYPVDRPVQPGELEVLRAEAEAVRDRLLAWAARVSRAVLQRVDGPALEPALRFAPGDRGFVHAALLRDPSGRLRQMVDVCPALLTLASAAPLPEAALDEVASGGRLDMVVDRLAGRVFAESSDASEAAAGAVAPAASARRLAWRAMVRRAPASLASEDLLMAALAPGAVASDIPRTPPHGRVPAGSPSSPGGDAGRWFAGMAAWRQVAVAALRDAGSSASRAPRTPEAFPPRLVQLGLFMSRRMVELHAAASEDQPLDELLRGLLHRCTQGGLPVPSRRRSVAAALRDVAAWHDALAAQRIQHERSREITVGPLITDRYGLRVEPIRTVGELLDEGRELHHCIGSFVPQGLAGTMCFYRAWFGGERLSVGLARHRDGWVLSQYGSVRNGPVSKEASRALAAWSLLVHYGDQPDCLAELDMDPA
jgi:hypothetical protein